MTKLEQIYELETGRKPRSQFSPSLEYVGWLENRLEEKESLGYAIVVSEQESWAVVTALSEYWKNPINDEHGILARSVYERIKELMLKKSKEEFLLNR